MLIIDTHCHAGLDKYEPVESLLYHMQTSGVSHAVLIQHGGQTDNSYHVDCLRRYPGKLASAMLVPENDDGTAMRQWAGQGLTGIRLRPTSRTQGKDPLIQWRTAQELGLVASVIGKPAGFLSPEFAEVLEAVPDLRIVIEHLGGVDTTVEPPYTEFQELLKLASRENLFMKMPGLGEYSRLPFPFAEVPPFAGMALEAFGVQRLMWGSDFPPVSGREGYANALAGARSQFAGLSEEEQGWVFGGTAMGVWGLATR